jgi:hypothetical protein
VAVDIANLTIKVDSSGVVTATGRLKELEQTGGRAETATDRLKSSWQKSLATYAKVAAGLLAIKKAMDFAKQAADLAAQVNQATTALENMAAQVGTSADEIVRSMQYMSGQTLSQLDVLQAANRAALLGIPLDELDRLMQVARASATALGTDVSQMFDDIVTGIGRGSKMILDNLGIVFSAEEAYVKFAEAQGKTVGQLTEFERKQAFLNATLEEGERIMKLVGEAGQEMTDTEPVQIYRAALKDLFSEIGQNLLPMMNALRLEMANLLGDIETALRTKRLMKEALGIEPSTIQDIEELREKLSNLGERLKYLQQQREELVAFAGTVAGSLLGGPTALEELDRQIAEIVQQMSALQQEIQRLQKAGEGLGPALTIPPPVVPPWKEFNTEVEKLLGLEDLVSDVSFSSLEQVNTFFWGLIDTMRAAGAPAEALSRAYRELFAWQEKFLQHQDQLEKAFVSPAFKDLPEWDVFNRKADERTQSLLEQAHALEMRLGPAQAAYNEELKHLQELEPYLTAETYAAAIEELKQKFPELTDAAAAFKVAMEDVGTSLLWATGQASLDVFRDIGAALQEGSLSAESFGEAMGRMVKTILDALPLMFLQVGLRLMMDQQYALGLGFIAAAGSTAIASGWTSAYLGSAQGNVFHEGSLVPFGAGGVVTRPTVFPMANGGMGLMAEKGWEAIMPLRRMANGNLGIEAAASPVYVTIKNYTAEPVQQKERRQPNGAREVEVIVGSIVRKQLTDGSLDKAMNANYGIKRQGQRV